MKVPIQRIPLIGSVPDLPVDTPGSMWLVTGIYPTSLGFALGPAAGVFNATNASEKPLGAVRLADATYTAKRYVGTPINLYEYDAAAYTNRTRAVGGAYGATDTNSWSFTQFGAISLAANKTDQLQFRTLNSATAFANVAGAPKLDVIMTIGPAASPFVMGLNYNDGTDVQDGWYCSAISDYTGWTAGTNQCAKGQITDNPGPFTAGIPFRDGGIAFKEDAMFAAEYVGSPIIWAWRRIASDVGCIGKNAVDKVNDTIYFAARDGIYMYDGSYPRKVPGQVHNFWAQKFATMAQSASAGTGTPNGPAYNRHLHQVKWFPGANLLGIAMCTDVNNPPTQVGNQVFMWYHLQTGKWIVDNRWAVNGFYRFVDPATYFGDASSGGGTWPNKAWSFSQPISQIAHSGFFSSHWIGGGAPEIITLLTTKIDYTAIQEQNIGLITVPFTYTVTPYKGSDDFVAQGYSGTAGTPVGVTVPITDANAWADFGDQPMSGNRVRTKYSWSFIASHTWDMRFDSIVMEVAQTGKDH